MRKFRTVFIALMDKQRLHVSQRIFTEKALDVLEIPGHGKIYATIIDVSNPLVFVRAQDINMKGTEQSCVHYGFRKKFERRDGLIFATPANVFNLIPENLKTGRQRCQQFRNCIVY